jgi:uncharacterized protein (DUF1330 family)
MSAYILASIDITDAQAFEDYRQRVPAVIAAYGGRYLVRGGAIHELEGKKSASRMVILEFADMARLQAFYNSADYQTLLAIRQGAAKSTLLAVEGV